MEYSRPVRLRRKKNPLTAKESAHLVRKAKSWVHAGSGMQRKYKKGQGYYRGRADGLGEAVLKYGPRRAQALAMRVIRRGEKLSIMNPGVGGFLANRGRVRGRKNPFDVTVAWTGKRANYVSPIGHYGTTGYSELAMHTGGAGKHVVRFALWRRPSKGYGPKAPLDMVNWAQVEYADGKVLDGLPSEVLPEKVRQIVGYQTARMPRRKQKLQLWALGRGVAVNRRRRR